MAYEPLHHKYRPQTFGDLVGQETIALTLSNALEQAKIAPAYLFTGPRGTGKTSSARILAKSLNCLNSDRPTPYPCGKCEVCLAIAKGAALDVMEIDAASNTGVDNIREIIERSRFAPVQCRYKIYAIDECLKGDSLIQTDNGLIRIDDPSLEGKKVLSYNENKEAWEYKQVLRWLERGTKKTLTIKTNNHQICCTGNHLIRTETGWIEAKNVKEGMKILSAVDASEVSIKNLETVESVSHAGHEQVYDLEVEDNHNFIANGLLVHNCHMLSTAAFNALLKTLEEPPPQVVFILATTDPQRVLSTIISRCQRFDYRRIPLIAMTSHLRYIAEAEAIAIADDALTLVAQIANGGLRDAESLLDQLSLLPETITVEKVWDLVGAVPEQDLLKLLQAINGNDSLAVLQQCRSLLDRGREPLVVLQNLAGFYLNLLIAKTAPNHSELTAVTETCWQQLCLEADNWQTALILRGQQHLQAAETQLKRTTQPRLWLEVALLGLLPEAQAAVQGKAIATPPTPENINTPSTPKTAAKPVEAIALQDIAPVEISASELVNRAIPPSVSAIVPPNTTPQEVAEHLAPPPVTTVNPPSAIPPEPILPPSQEQDPVANQQIWSKVVSCLQPPTTQALLRQQCHLVNFDGMSAIVGVSSANLQKMTQQKIPNIEAAFTQVCQRKVRVQLEVVSSQRKIAPNSTAPINQATTQTSSVPEQPPDPPPPARVLTVASRSNVSMNNQSSPRQQSQATLTTPLVTPNVTSDHSQLGESDRSNGRASSTQTNSPPVSVNNLAFKADPLSGNPEAEVTLNESFEDSNLQQAIANLTQNFEGEVVQLDNNLNYLDEDGDQVLPQSDDLNDPPILFERPDVEEYDDEW